MIKEVLKRNRIGILTDSRHFVLICLAKPSTSLWNPIFCLAAFVLISCLQGGYLKELQELPDETDDLRSILVVNGLLSFSGAHHIISWPIQRFWAGRQHNDMISAFQLSQAEVSTG